MQPIDSKKRILTFPEVIGHALMLYGFKGEKFTKAALLLMEEMKVQGCEAVNINNTVFIGHYTPDRRTAVLKVLNADTHKNLLGNVQLFLQKSKEDGTDLFVYFHDDKTPTPIFSFIEQKKLGSIQTGKNEDGKFATIINLSPGPSYMQRQEEAEIE